MAEQALRLLSDLPLARRLRSEGLREASQYAWPHVRKKWYQAYLSASAVAAGVKHERPLIRVATDQHDPE
jgi:hypothetical protein